MKPSLIFAVAAALLGLGVRTAITARADEVRYTFDDPGEGWSKPAFDDHDWKTAHDLPVVAKQWREVATPAVWIRSTREMTWQQINNSYFHVAQDVPVDLSVNGKFLASIKKPSVGTQDFPVTSQRGEVVGRNVYGMHLTAGAGERALDITHVIGSWVPVKERVVRSNPAVRESTRDSEACLGPDGYYYLAATSGEAGFFSGPRAWMDNPGILLRRSADLVTWENMGWVWTFERDATWNREAGTFHNRPARAVWAPEISYFNGQYWLVYSVNFSTAKHSFGIGILHAEKPEGPWQEVSPERPVSEGYDPSLFRDDDGIVYLLRNKSMIARLKDDLSGLAEPFRTLAAANFPCVGFEGPCLFKYKGRYHLAAAETMLHADGKTSYDCVVASADHVYGPYGPRYLAIRYGGHNGFSRTRTTNCVLRSGDSPARTSRLPFRISK